MAKTLSLTNLVDIECDSLMIQYKDICDIFLTKGEGQDIVGLSPETLNTLEKIANAIGNDANYFNTINAQLSLKANSSNVYDKIYINNLITNYYTIEQTTTLLSSKLDSNVITNYYTKSQTDNFLNLRYTKTETDNLLDLKADKLDTYTKTSTDNLLNNKLNTTTYNAGIILKANISDTYDKSVLYTKLETDSFLNLKSNSVDVYTKTSVDNLLNNKLDASIYNANIILKANLADVYDKTLLYTKSETDTLLLNKLNNNALNNYYDKTYINTEFNKYYLKTYIDNLITDLNDNINLKLNAANILNYYSKTETDALFSNLINSAPEAMNTLKELADALGNDANYATTVENQIATKRNISDSYSIIETNNLLNNKVNNSDFNNLTSKFIIDASLTQIKGGTGGVRLQDNLGNNILKVAATGVQSYQHFIGTSAEFTGDVTANNLYSITQVDNLLNAKQNTLIDRGGDGVVIIDIGTSNKVSRIFGSNIDVYRYLNLGDNTDPKNYNILIDATALKNSIDANTDSINTLSTNVNVNSLDILSLNLNLTSGLNARYTKTESDNRYYTQSQVDTLNNSKQDLLNSGNTVNLNVGRGLVYLESSFADNQDGSGVTLRVASNPNSGGMFSVRSSGGGCRFWVGQSLTTSGLK